MKSWCKRKQPNPNFWATALYTHIHLTADIKNTQKPILPSSPPNTRITTHSSTWSRPCLTWEDILPVNLDELYNTKAVAPIQIPELELELPVAERTACLPDTTRFRLLIRGTHPILAAIITLKMMKKLTLLRHIDWLTGCLLVAWLVTSENLKLWWIALLPGYITLKTLKQLTLLLWHTDWLIVWPGWLHWDP